MKYIDVKELKEKISNLENHRYYSGDFHDGVLFTIEEVQSIIDSLQQEQPDNEDIDKVAQELYEHLYELKRRNNVPTNLYDKQEIIDLWKAGIVYGRSHPKQEQPEVDIDDEIDRVIADYSFTKTIDSGGFKTTMLLLDYKKIARHFYDLGQYNAKKKK